MVFSTFSRMTAIQTPVTTGSGPEATYLQALREGRFEIQHCANCRKYVFYPRLACPYCGAARLEWVKPSGRGTVYSTTTVRRKPELGGDYNVALVDLEEGPRLMSRVEEVAPSEVAVGMAVVAQIRGTSELPAIVFVPVKASR
jgi:uncharacterized protein